MKNITQFLLLFLIISTLIIFPSQYPLCRFKGLHTVIHEHVCSGVSVLTQ